MEELTIEQKAKLYDEAIKRVENIRTGKCETAFIFTEGMFEHIFPELAESEDERIRKEIIFYLKRRVETSSSIPAAIGYWIAWLEKQSENITTLPKWKYKNDNTPLLRDSLILNKYGCVAKSPSGAIVSDVWVIDYDELAKLPKEEFEKQVEQKPNLDVEIPFGTDSELVEEAITIPDGCYAIIKDNKVILRKGEKKSSWSEEDEENLNWFEKFFRAESVISGGKDIPQDRYLWFKNLKDRVQPQPQQQWSEEDERKMRAIITIINSTSQSIICSIDQDRESLVNWLKSLRPQSTWKPSDEQMKAIRIAYEVGTANDSWAKKVLKELYKELRKSYYD